MSFGDLFQKPLPSYLLPNDKDHQLMASLGHQPSPPTNQDYQQPISLSIYPNHHFPLYPAQPLNSSSQAPPPFSNRSSSNSSSSPNSSTTNNNALHSFTPPKHLHLTPTSDQLFSELLPPPPQQPPIEHHHLNQPSYLFHQSDLLNPFSATPSPTDPQPTNTFDTQASPHSSPLLDLSAYALWPTGDPLPSDSKLSGAESLFQQQADLAASFYNPQPPPVVSSDQAQLPEPIPLPIPPLPPPPPSGTTQYKLIDPTHHHTHNFQPQPTTHHHHHLNQQIPECQTTAEESGHNAVEKRYRNNINSHIAALADLVPALQHLRSLPSAATSRRHSSQFIVSTSAIGKIPSGLVDGVKAATKLSKGNILSKSVDYVKHLLRTRLEMQEDVEELKTLIKYRVEGGQILVLEWEEKVNSKIPERERARLMDQSQGEEDLDEEEEQKQSHQQQQATQQQQQPLNKKRKAGGGGIGVGGRRGINKEVVPVVIDELEMFRQPSSTSDVFGSAAAVPYPTDFVPGGGNQFGQSYHPAHQNRRFGNLPASNMLAASMGLSFAAGSAYHYYSYSSPSPSHRPSEAQQEASQIMRQITPGSSTSALKAGLDTVSMASIIFVLVVLLRPEFLLSFVATSRGKDKKKKRRTRVLDSDSEEDSERDPAAEIGLGTWLRELSGQLLTATRAEEKELVRTAEVESLSLLGARRRSVFKRAMTSFQLYCLIDWNRHPQPRLMALLSLHLRTVLGAQNLLSKKLWDQARAASSSSSSALDYVHEALQSTFAETCSLLSTSLKQSGAISTEPLMRIVERKSELQLIEIWSRILVSAMRKTCPIQTPSSRLARDFKLDTIDGLPTRVEEAGDAYALQITAARELVDRSIDKISSIGIDRLSPIGSLARLTKGVWALAFSRTHVAKEVAEELLKEKAWAAVVPYLDLVLGQQIVLKEDKDQRGVMTRLEKLATVTISWLSLRKSHLTINVLPNQTWFKESDQNNRSNNNNNTSSNRLMIHGLVKQAEDLKSLIAADPVLETDTDLVNGSVKQSVEAVKSGESREYDLIRALVDCSHNVDVVWKIGSSRLDQLIKDGGMDSSS